MKEENGETIFEVKELKCPECKEVSFAKDWRAGETGCEDCGSHSAVFCPKCDEPFDHVWGYDKIESENNLGYKKPQIIIDKFEGGILSNTTGDTKLTYTGVKKFLEEPKPDTILMDADIFKKLQFEVNVKPTGIKICPCCKIADCKDEECLIP